MDQRPNTPRKPDNDDDNDLTHTLVYHQGADRPRVDYLDVVITRCPPGVRDDSGEKK